MLLLFQKARALGSGSALQTIFTCLTGASYLDLAGNRCWLPPLEFSIDRPFSGYSNPPIFGHIFVCGNRADRPRLRYSFVLCFRRRRRTADGLSWPSSEWARSRCAATDGLPAHLSPAFACGAAGAPSVADIFSLAAALEAGWTPARRDVETGSVEVQRLWRGRGCHGWDVALIRTFSCNPSHARRP